MKYLWLIAAFLFIQEIKAQELIVKDVRVSVKADSAGAARDQAIEQAYSLAFQKLLKENFPEKSGSLPSQNVLMNMVTEFSIDREKTTPKSYTASLTFQFDKMQIQSWIQQGQVSSSSSSTFQSTPTRGRALKLIASYETLSQWQQIKRTLEACPGVQKVTIFSFSPQKATLEIVLGGDIRNLQQNLLQNDLLLIPQGDAWIISSNTMSLQ